MTDRTKVTLPHGLRRDGRTYRDAELRGLSGYDEESLAQGTGTAAERVTEILAHCVERLGPHDEVEMADIRALTVGDREALLLQLRRLLVGDRVPCVVTCPSEGCGEKLQFDVDLARVLLPPYREMPEWHEHTVDGRRVRFRLPTGADQEAVAPLAATDSQRAGAELVAACVASGHDDSVVDAVSEAMSALDPQAEVQLQLECAECGHTFHTILDAAWLLGREIANDGSLYREVHELALHYHWSERDILALPTTKRRRYLELLADSVGVS